MTNANGVSDDSPRGRITRGSLSRDAVVEAACHLADAEGLDAVTMRAVAGRLGCKPMSLYRHVAHKEELLDALVERVFTEFELPDPTRQNWRAELRRRTDSVRQALVRHPWALLLLETRTGPHRPVTFTHAEAVLATLVGAGCSARMAARALVALDSYVYGFALQEITMASTNPDEATNRDIAAALQPYPTMVAVMEAVTSDADYDFGAEFGVGLELVLDGIQRWRDEATGECENQ